MNIKLNPDGTFMPSDSQPASPRGIISDEGPAQVMGPDEIVKDSDSANFMADVVEASNQVPVIVDFWAPWCGPCKQLGPLLEKLVKQAGGMVRMVKVNIDENQEIATQLRVQSIPMVYAFKDGRPVDAFSGAIPESQIKAFIDKLLDGAKAPLDAALDEAKGMLGAGEAHMALQLYRQIQAEDPANEHAIAGIIRSTLASGDVDATRGMIESLSADLLSKMEISAAVSAFQLSEESKEAGDATTLEGQLLSNPDDHQARYDLAITLLGSNQNQAAVDQLIELIRRNRLWNDEAGRKQLLKIFDAMGPSHEVTLNGRRQLSSVLFS